MSLYFYWALECQKFAYQRFFEDEDLVLLFAILAVCTLALRFCIQPCKQRSQPLEDRIWNKQRHNHFFCFLLPFAGAFFFFAVFSFVITFFSPSLSLLSRTGASSLGASMEE